MVEVAPRPTRPFKRGWAAASLFIALGSGCVNDGGDPVPPVLAAIGEKTTKEGRAMAFSVSAAAAGRPLTVTASGLPTGATFANGQFDWTLGYQDAGAYTVTFKAESNGLVDSEAVAITVRQTFFKPMADIQGTEGQLASLTVATTRSEGDSVTVTGLGLPEGAFVLDGEFTWFPSYMDSGWHDLVLVGTAAGASDTDTVRIHVANTPVSFARDVQQAIFNNQCIECHSAPGGLGYSETGGQFNNGLDLTDTASYTKLLGTSGQGAITFQNVGLIPKWRIRPGDLRESYLLQKVDTSQTPKFGKSMPLDGFGGYVEPYNLAALKAWILEGAKNN